MEKKNIILERDYNVPLRRGFLLVSRYKRAKKAVKTLREFIQKHMKTEDVRIGQHLNEYIWGRGIKNPPHHVKVHAVKDAEGVVKVELFGKEYKDSIKPIEKEEPKGLKEKLIEKVSGGKEEKSEIKEEKQKKEEPKKEREKKKQTTKNSSGE